MAAFYVGQIDYITQLNILESRIITLPIVIGNSGKFLYTDGNTTSWQTALTITDVNTAVAIETTRATTAEALKAPIASPTFTGTVSGITKAMVGLGQVDNTSDVNKPVSTATTTAIGVETTRALAAEALLAPQTTTYTKTETDTRIQVVVGAAPAALDTLVEIAAQLSADESAAAALTTAVSLKAPIASPTFTGTVSGITKAMVGLGQVDNTTDINKPVSTATTTAIGVETTRALAAEALKAPIASPTFTGTVSGITKTMVGLDQVDNTTDINKPVSTATTTAIGVETTRATTAEALLAPIASPTFTGTTTIPTLNLTNALAVAYGGTGIITAPANGTVDIGNGTGFNRTTLTAGSGISITNAAGSITITATSGGGTVTSVTGTAPVVSSGGSTPAISMAAASSGVNGYMTGVYATKLDGIATGATANTGTVTGVTGTAPVVSSGGTAPAISMAAASSGINGYMTGVYATKLDGIATGATANTGTVTGVTGTAPVVSSGGTAPAISMAAASAGVNGYMTGVYATKLDGIATGATNVTNNNQLTNGSGYITSAFSGFMLRSTSSQANPNTNFNSSAYRFDPNANNPTSEHYAIVTYGNESNVTGQLATHFVSGQTYTRAYNTVWSAWRTQLDSSNYNSYAPTLTGGGASGTWGINVTGTSGSISGFNNPTTAASGNTIVYRDGSGHITGYYGFFNYLNMSHGASGSTTDTVFYSSGDDYIRKNNATGFRASLNVPTRTGGDASGTWGINVTGSATFLTSSNYINQTGNTGTWNSDFQNTPAGTARYGGDVGAQTTNNPGGSWWIQQNFRHTNGNNYWGTQVAWGWEDNANRLATRNVTNGTFGGWVYYLNNANYNSYAPTLTGTGASGTWSISVTGSAASATVLTNAGSGISASQAGTSYSNVVCVREGPGSSAPRLGFHWANVVASSIAVESSGRIAITNNPGSGYENLVCSAFTATSSITSSGNVTAYSDERLKTNWRDLQSDFIEQLAKVKHGIYDRTDQEMTQVGVSAQSLQPVLEYAVVEEEDGTLAVAYGNAAMVSAVELAKRVVEQEARIARLETLVNKLIGE